MQDDAELTDAVAHALGHACAMVFRGNGGQAVQRDVVLNISAWGISCTLEEYLCMVGVHD